MDIVNFAERLEKFNAVSVIIDILNKPTVQKFIIDLNTKEQLFKGIDSTSKKLSDIGGNYSPKTLKSKPYSDISRVNLKDSGKYYDSFYIKPLSNGDFLIISNPIKDGVSLEKRWGDNLEGLTTENTIIFNEYFEEKVSEFYQSLLQGNI